MEEEKSFLTSSEAEIYGELPEFMDPQDLPTFQTDFHSGYTPVGSPKRSPPRKPSRQGSITAEERNRIISEYMRKKGIAVRPAVMEQPAPESPLRKKPSRQSASRIPRDQVPSPLARQRGQWVEHEGVLKRLDSKTGKLVQLRQPQEGYVPYYYDEKKGRRLRVKSDDSRDHSTTISPRGTQGLVYMPKRTAQYEDSEDVGQGLLASIEQGYYYDDPDLPAAKTKLAQIRKRCDEDVLSGFGGSCFVHPESLGGPMCPPLGSRQECRISKQALEKYSSSRGRFYKNRKPAAEKALRVLESMQRRK